MTRWINIRAKAFQVTKNIRAKFGEDLRGLKLLEEIINDENIIFLSVPADDPLLGGEDGNYCQATYEPQLRTITVNEDAAPNDYLLYIGHELGHHFLHRREDFCNAENVSPEHVGLTVPYGEGRVATYSSLQQQEVEANIFAAELLMPSMELCRKFDAGTDVDALAAFYKVSRFSILAQLANVALEPPIDFDQILYDESKEPFHWKDLDSSQQEAACIGEGPVRVDAGPGTGKTRTLIGRTEWLIENRTPPDTIIILTFSNKATDEVRRRLRQVLPDQVHQVTVTTFHGFGVELLRRYGSFIGIDPRFSVLDPIDAQELLINNIDQLELHHYADLANPGKHLADDSILAFIGRLRQELITPEQFESYINDPKIEFPGDDLEKYREISFVYSQYQQLKRRENVVDYDDLVMFPVIILRNHPELLEAVQNQYGHILVDEFQDINQANGELIRQLAGNGSGLWTVGDLRQSIYRWRGASPTYLEQFPANFPNAKPLCYLRINYRSSPRLVNYFADTVSQLGLMKEPTIWEASRKDIGENNIYLVQASDKQNEVQGILSSVRELTVRHHYLYSDFAILCRTHRIAAYFAEALREAGIPVLHFGNFYERQEIKDLLAIIDLTINPHSVSWLRVANTLSTPLGWEKALDLWKQARSSNLAFPEALKNISCSAILLEAQATELEQLEQVISRYQYKSQANPWLILVEFLFSYGHYLRRLRADLSNNMPKLLAIGHLLQLARVHSLRKPFNSEYSKAQAFLSYIRTLVGRDDADTPTPSVIEGVDAVNILTIHKAKGLEFPVVFIPRVDAVTFPPQRGGHRFIKPPTGLVASLSPDVEEQEEKSALFVAMSRARDYLFLSYASKQDNGKNRYPSRLWSLIKHGNTQNISWEHINAQAIVKSEMDELHIPEIDQALDRASLRRIQQCPRQFYYQDFQKLLPSANSDVYPKFYASLIETMNWILQIISIGQTVELESAITEYLKRFQDHMPAVHVHRNWYLEKGKKQIATFLSGIIKRRLKGKVEYQVPLNIKLEGFSVDIIVDELITTEVGHEAVYHRIGHSRSGKHMMHLYRQALRDNLGELKLWRHSLLDDVQEESSLKDEKAIEAELLTNLRHIQNGNFTPTPSSKWVCATCPFYLICAI